MVLILFIYHHGKKDFLYNPDRPLQFIWFEFQNIIIGDNATIGIYYVFIFSFITILASYILFFLIFNSKKKSLFFSIIYTLVFSKIEIYHAPVYIFINLASSLYIFSLIFFISFIKFKKLYFLFISFFFYGIAILWYEVGFFIPLAMVAYLFIFEKKQISLKSINLFIPYFIILISYSIYRATGAFGSVEIFAGRQINLFTLPYGLLEVFNTFLGKYFVKNIIYGIYIFLSINIFWIIILLIINFFILFFLNNLLIKIKNLEINRNILLFFSSLFIVTIVPNILVGSLASRNIIISSIPYVIFIYIII